MLKKVPCVTLIFSVFLLLLLFSNVNLASAEDTAGSEDCASNLMTETLEILRLGLTPSLKDSEGVGSSSELRMTDRGISNPYSLIPSPSSKCSDSGQNESSVESDAQLSAKRVGQRAMYRLYNKWTGEHFYTCSEEERDEIAKVGWTKEDIGWVSPKESSTPVYRLYNKYIPGGDHHYTPNADERDSLVKVGWIYEGIGWYSADEGSLFRAPVYRQYNPYADTGTHNYTLSTSEKNNLVKAGWHDEGVGYYGLDQSQMSAIDFNKDIKVTTTSKVYNGKAQTQTITSSNLKLDEDYIVEYANNKNVGTATITITGINGFYGEKVYTFKITQKTVSQVKWGATEFAYDGKAHVPTATAVGLCSGDSATITVTASGNHTDTGTYTATATAISNKNYKLASNFKTDFRIGTKIDFDNKNKPTVDTADEVYTGSVITKEVSVAGLTKDKDYTVTYKDNVNVGTATLTIKGIGEYFGEKSYTFKITQKSLAGATITAETLTYNGSEQAAKISKVTLDGRNLKEGTDFKVVSGNKGKDANTYDGLTIGGIGNYKSQENNGSWTISPKTVGIDWSDTSMTYDGTPKTPTATVTDVYGSDSVTATVVVTEENHTNTGTYHATATKLDNTNYQLPTPTPTTTFEIVAKEATEEETKDIKLELDGTDYVYDKTAKEPQVTGIPAKFVKDTDYSIEYSNNVNAGTNTAKVKVEFKGNYKGSKEFTFSIDKKPITVSSGVTANGKTYDGKTSATIDFSKAEFSGVCADATGTKDDVTLKTATGTYADKNIGENKAITLSNLTLDGTDKDNYTVATTGNQQPTATISAKTVTISGLTAKERAYVENDTSVTLEGTAKFAEGDICDGDTVTITSTTGTYADANATDNKDATLTFALTGNDYGNYVISEGSKTIKGNVLAIVKFDSQCSVTLEDKYVHIGMPLVKDDVSEKLPSRAGIYNTGWFNNTACTVDTDKEFVKWDFGTSAVTQNVTTLYANWDPTEDATENDMGYWVAPAEKSSSVTIAAKRALHNNEDYVAAEHNVQKTANEIREDIKVLADTNHETYTEDKYNEANSLWTEYMNEDEFHLYTKIGEGTEETDYAEFRIVQVGPHDGDGSVLTFIMSHVLPNNYQIHTTMTNSVGWGGCTMYKSMNSEDGEINQLFNATLKNDIMEIDKKTSAGNQSSTILTSENKLWIYSEWEVFGSIDSHNYNENVYKSEGSQYAWYSSRGISYKANTTFVNDTKRGSTTVSGLSFRSPATYDIRHFIYANGGGGLARSTSTTDWGPNYPRPIQVCFALGDGKKVTFDTQGHGITVAHQHVLNGSKLSDPTASAGASTGLKIEGWYNNPACAVDEDKGMKKWNFAADAVTEDVTLYANWVPDDSADGASTYWIAPSYKVTTGNTEDTSNQSNNAAEREFARDSYVSEEWNVLKSSKEIQEDLATMKTEKTAGTSENTNSVTSEYRAIMNSDKYHLYTKYNGDDFDATANPLNAYAEFRIIQVGEHLNDSSDVNSGDESTLTFMATHSLPTAMPMNSSGKNEGGWGSSEMRNPAFADGGYVQSGLSSLVSATKLIKKVATTGSKGSWVEGSSTDDQFWLMSYSELFGENSSLIGGSTQSFKAEGTQYDWCKTNVTDATGKNFSIANIDKTRSSDTPVGAYDDSWSLRSPLLLYVYSFGSVNSNGKAVGHNVSYSFGVVPAFAM